MSALCVVVSLVAIVHEVAAASASEASVRSETLLRLVKRDAPVKRSMYRSSARLAIAGRGAVLELRRKYRNARCPEGWYARLTGGFVCGRYLARTEATRPRAAPDDEADIIAGLSPYRITGGGALLYPSLSRLEAGRAAVRLVKDSYLMVRRTIKRGGRRYLETREGGLAEARNSEKLPPPVDSLAVEIDAGGGLGALVVDANAPVRASPEENAEELRTLARWERLGLAEGQDALEEGDGWIALSGGGYIRDAHVARLRKPPAPREVKGQDRWIAVDVAEQLVQAYEGGRLVKIIPCSTGSQDNTAPGRYRIQWKRRRQTMRLRGGRERVEDVQWVMYYHRRRGIALHSAYWHDDFGHPVSHGCVNLPREDARWLFEWSSPEVAHDDSERFPTHDNPGSQVIVFR